MFKNFLHVDRACCVHIGEREIIGMRANLAPLVVRDCMFVFISANVMGFKIDSVQFRRKILLGFRVAGNRLAAVIILSLFAFL